MSVFAPPFSGAACPRLIVKVGSSLLVAADGTVRRDWLTSLVADLADRVRAGQEIAIVSSGAIALGARRLKLPKGGRASLEDAQAAAATGQIALSQVWAELLGAEGLTAAQMLVTLDDLEDRRRYLNASATLGRLLSLGVVPVINENDSVATAEIRFGDNDRLAARVAQAAACARSSGHRCHRPARGNPAPAGCAGGAARPGFPPPPDRGWRRKPGCGRTSAPPLRCCASPSGST